MNKQLDSRLRGNDGAKEVSGFKPRLQFLITAFLASLILHTPAGNAAIAGKVQFTYGNVKATTPSGVTRSLVKGEAVNEGDSISTALTSSAQIKMMDGGLVAIRPDTQMKFDKFVFNGKQDGSERGYFTLVRGGFRAVTGLVGKVNKHNYKISTATATIGIRGTDHETYVVPQGVLHAAAGAYSKVNVGETTLTTNKGTVNVLPNQMGFSSGMNELPKLQPINTNLFTVSAAPTKTIKETKQEEKEAGEKKTAEKQSAQETKQAAKEENKKESTQEAKQESAKDTKQIAKPAVATTTAEADAAVTPVTGGATAGGTTASAPSPAAATPDSPVTIAEAAPLRTDTKMDAPSSIMAVAAVAPVVVPVPIVETVATPITPAVVEAKPVVTVAMTDTSGNTLDATNQTVTTSTNLVATVTAVVEVIAANLNSANPTIPVSLATAVTKVINPVITDTIANLLSNANVTTNTDVRVTDAATLSELATLQSRIGTGGVMTYSSVIDTLANLNANTGGYVTTGKTVIVSDTIANLINNTPAYSIAGKDIVVTDAASIAQLTAIDSSNGTGNITATIVNDTAASLAGNAGGYVAAGKNVTVTDVLTIAQLTAIDAANGGGALTYTALSDTATTLAASAYVTTGKSVTVTDPATLAQLATIASKHTGGTLIATAISDTVAGLSTSTYVKPGVNLNVTDMASIAQLTALAGKNTGGSLNYTLVGDTVTNLVAKTGGYPAGVNLKVTDIAAISDLVTISATNPNGSVTATTVSDNSITLINKIGTYVLPATNVTVTNAVSIADLTLIDNAAGVVSYQTILDTTNNLTKNAGGYVAAGKHVTVTDAASIAQLTTIDTTNGGGTLTYTALSDTAAILAASAYVTPGKIVAVSDAGSISQLAAIRTANGGAALTYNAVNDTVANLTTNTGGFVATGKNVTITDVATLAQLTALATNNTGITLNATSISDTAAGLSNSTYVKPGVNLTVTDAASLVQLATLASKNTGGTLNATTINDTVAALTISPYVNPGVNLFVTDPITLAQLATLAARNTGGTLGTTAIVPPVGATANWESFSHLAVGTTGSWDRGRFNTGLLPQTNTNFLLDANGNLVKSLHVQYNERATWNSTGSVNNYADANVTYSGGVASDYFQVADGSLTIGRWTGGQMTITDNNGILTPLVKNLGPTSAYWGLGTSTNPSVVQSLTGTTTFTPVGATRPTDTFGNVGTGLVASLVANFNAMTVDASVAFTIANQNLSVAATAVSIVPGGNYFDATFETGNAPTVTCTGTCAGAGYLGWMTGTFFGAGASNADVSYKIWPTAPQGSVVSDIIQGVVAFNTTTPPILAPGKAVAITLQDAYGSRWIWNNTFTTLAGNVRTAVPSPLFAFDWGGGNSNSSVILGGASGAVNGTAISASTGIQFGRYTSISSITQFHTGSFDGIFGNNRTGQWAYGVAGYLDSPTTLALATNGTVTGTFGYVLDGAQSAPVDWDGNKGVLNSLTLTANFATNQLDTALKATMGATVWNASATGVSLSVSNPTFNAGSNSFGQASSVTKGPQGTETCTTCSWYLNGAFTGQNYAGAVVSFGLSDNLMSGNSSGLDGVAALTRGGVVTNPTVTNATGTVAPTSYAVATAGANTGVNTQTVANVTMNANNVLTGYSTSSPATGGPQWSSSTTITCFSCTGQLATDFANTGIRLGTWDVGASANTWTDPVNGGQFHWITGPVVSAFLVESLLGTATYALDGGTAPTAQTLINGVASAAVTGTLSSANLTVDFNKQTASLIFAVTADGHNWVVSSTGAPIGSSNGAGSSAFAASSFITGPGALSVLLDGVAVTNMNANGRGSYVSGQLTGAALNGALFQYDLSATQTAVIVPTTLSAIDGMVLQAPITVTGPLVPGGSSTFAFTGPMAPLAATTTTLNTSFGTPTTLSTAGGVAMTASSFVPQGAGGSFDGIVSVAGINSTLGEKVQLNLLGAKVTSSGAGTGGLQYSDFGWWRKYPTMTALSPATTTGTFTVDVFAGGYLLTPAAAMSTAINATYTGAAWAMAMDGAGNYFLQGSSNLTADFINSTYTGSLTGLTVTNASTNLAMGAFNDLTLTGTISPAGNALTGTSLVAGAVPTLSPSLIALATNATTTGYSSGHFYGPNANEVTGAWGLTSGALSVTGAFGAANGTSINQTTQLSVNGVAALNQTSAAIDPATVSSRWAIFTFTDPVKGLQVNASNNNSSRVIVDGVGNVTAFDLVGNNGGGGGNQNVYTTAETITIDANVVKNDTGVDAVSGITWGRWSGGNLIVTDKVTTAAVPSVANTNTHWIAGPTTVGQVTLPVTGTFDYVLAGGSKPTDSLGIVGTLNNASLQANFNLQTVNVGVNATVNATNYVATGTNLPIQQGQFSNDKGGTYTATANGAAAQGFVGGVFTGATGNGAAVVYGFLNGATVVNGVAAFHR